jgi:hypothetical protein
MSLTIIGIDPGQTGGIAILNGAITVKPMPDIWSFASEIGFHAGFGDNLHVFIEKAQAFKGQGISSTFGYGVHYGELLGVLAAHQVKHTLVRPVEWTKFIHKGTKATDPKARTLEAVRRLFPGVDLRGSARSTKAHSGIVDALALAYFGKYSLKEVNIGN